MSPASRSASRAASQSGGGRRVTSVQPGGEGVQVFAGVVDVHDRGGFGQDRGGEVPDPGRAVAEDDELADVVGAAAAGFGVHQGGELVGGGEAAQVAGRVRVAHRPALVVDGGLGEQAGEFDLAGAGAPVAALAGAAGDGGGHHGHAGAVDGDVELVRRPRSAGAGSTLIRRCAIAADSAGMLRRRRRRRRPRRSVRSVWGTTGFRPARRAGRRRWRTARWRAARATIVRSPGDSDAPVTPSSSSRGTIPRLQMAQW